MQIFSSYEYHMTYAKRWILLSNAYKVENATFQKPFACIQLKWYFHNMFTVITAFKKNIVHSMFLLMSALFDIFNVCIFLSFCFVLIGNFCLKLYKSTKHILKQFFSFHLVKTELKYLYSFHFIVILVKLGKKGQLWQKC